MSNYNLTRPELIVIHLTLAMMTGVPYSRFIAHTAGLDVWEAQKRTTST